MLTRRTLLGTALVAGALSTPAAAQSDDRPSEIPAPDIRIAMKLTGLDGGELSEADFLVQMDIVSNRAEWLSTSFINSRVDYPNRLIIHLTGVNDVELAMTAITSRGFVELIDPEGEYLEAGEIVVTSVGGQPWPRWDGARTATRTGSFTTIVSGDEIASNELITGALGAPVIGFELTDSGADALKRFTQANIGKPMAIVVDNRVVSSPIVNDVIEREGIIEGLTETEADALRIQLNLRPLHARVEVERYLISPRLRDQM